MKNITPLFNIVKYTNYLLCLFDIQLTNNYYFKSFLNELIIEFFKIGENKEFLKEINKEELRKILEEINTLFLNELLND